MKKSYHRGMARWCVQEMLPKRTAHFLAILGTIWLVPSQELVYQLHGGVEVSLCAKVIINKNRVIINKIR